MLRQLNARERALDRASIPRAPCHVSLVALSKPSSLVHTGRRTAPQRDATRRNAFSVNTLSSFNAFDYCGAARRSSLIKHIELAECVALRCVALRRFALRCGVPCKLTSILANLINFFFWCIVYPFPKFHKSPPITF